MCNLVTLDTGSNYSCNSEGGLLPGYISGLSKAPCKLWKAISLSEDKDIEDIVFVCMDHNDGEILRLPKSNITCKVFFSENDAKVSLEGKNYVCPHCPKILTYFK